jgi:hypothetical protein
MARFAFEALGIELTEGQPDSANKANEKKFRTMKKLGDGYTAQTWLVNANPGLGSQGAYNQVGLAAEYFCPSLNYLVYAPASY